MIAAHGGVLVDRVAGEEQRPELRARAGGLKRIALGPREISDLVLLAVGAFSPLEGFLTSADYYTVVRQGRLANGVPWTIPITLPVSAETGEGLKRHEQIGLWSLERELLGILELRDIFACPKEEHAARVFGTTELRHPGVAHLYQSGDMLLGGPITLLDFPPVDTCYRKHLFHPYETRSLFQERGWKTVVGFQTRNPIHRSHEYIQKCALEIVDGLLIHPLVGETKSDDIPAPVRMQCYEALVEHYYPRDRVVLSVFPAAMRYAGPREAVFHALVRKNYGCTHFIVGRDHAGVGDFYGPYDAQRIFEQYTREEIGIQPLCFEATFYCRRCGHIVSSKTCPHGDGDHITFSGTRVRETLSRGESLPEEFTRPEIAEILTNHTRPRVVQANKNILLATQGAVP